LNSCSACRNGKRPSSAQPASKAPTSTMLACGWVKPGVGTAPTRERACGPYKLAACTHTKHPHHVVGCVEQRQEGCQLAQHGGCREIVLCGHAARPSTPPTRVRCMHVQHHKNGCNSTWRSTRRAALPSRAALNSVVGWSSTEPRLPGLPGLHNAAAWPRPRTCGLLHPLRRAAPAHEAVSGRDKVKKAGDLLRVRAPDAPQLGAHIKSLARWLRSGGWLRAPGALASGTFCLPVPPAHSACRALTSPCRHRGLVTD
jgi:hypothetical protein